MKLRLVCALLPLLCLSMLLVPAEAAGRSQVFRGSWKSQSTGHTGPMRVRITPRGDGRYDARFTGRFAVIIPFTYRVELTATCCSGGVQSLAAHKRLGPVLGSYDMSAQMTPSGLWGNFQAAGDTGTVSMRRVR
ncbi:MAG: hypothetical protein ACTHOU_12395 [Aureliella sp.]